MLLAAAVLLASAAHPGLAAEAVRENRPVSGFSMIEIAGQADVVLRQGTTEALTLEASAQALQSIRTVVRDRTLIIEINEQRRWWDWMLGGGPTRTPRVTIDFVKLDSIEAAGVVRFDIASLKTGDLRLDLAGACSMRIGDLQASRLRVDGSGAVKMTVAGRVPTQSIDLSGAGSYQAGKLVSESATLQVSGAGKALVNTSKSLKVDISGAGVVNYIGNPTLEQQISGVSKVRRVESP
jgi:hypothetical protein